MFFIAEYTYLFVGLLDTAHREIKGGGWEREACTGVCVCILVVSVFGALNILPRAWQIRVVGFE